MKFSESLLESAQGHNSFMCEILTGWIQWYQTLFFFSCCLSGKLLFLIGLRKKKKKGGGENPVKQTHFENIRDRFLYFWQCQGKGKEGRSVCLSRRWGEPLISARVLWMLPMSVWAKVCCCICQRCSGMYKTNLLGLHCTARGVMSNECDRLWAVMMDSLAESWTRPALPVAVSGEPGSEARQSRYCLSSCQQPFPHYPGVLSSSKLLACVRHIRKHLWGLLKDHLANVGPRSQRKGSGRNSLEVIVVNWSICSLFMGWGEVCVLVSYTLKKFFFIPKGVLPWSVSLHLLWWGMLAA